MSPLPLLGCGARLQVQGARSSYEQGAREVAALEERRADLRAERGRNAEVLPGLEREKTVRDGFFLLSFVSFVRCLLLLLSFVFCFLLSFCLLFLLSFCLLSFVFCFFYLLSLSLSLSSSLPLSCLDLYFFGAKEDGERR